MDKIEAIELLNDKKLDIEKVAEIYFKFRGDKEIDGAVAMNLSQKTSVYNREQGRSEIMVKLLIELSKSEDMGSRWAVAKNPHTPTEILEELSKDKINLVRALVATNPNTPKSVLETLFNDEKIVRDGLSGNPNTPQEILEELSKDMDKMVRMRVAENPSTPKHVLEKLLNDPDENVVKASQANLDRRRS
ncbi:MAG TPA: hypothetical protein EYG60_00880 [Campylobacterales bacterium]|nr:hypothetical protein [Campylobacterales bacterium]